MKNKNGHKRNIRLASVFYVNQFEKSLICAQSIGVIVRSFKNSFASIK